MLNRIGVDVRNGKTRSVAADFMLIGSGPCNSPITLFRIRAQTNV